jgi:poly(beta-D-mannuronate) lyase
MKEIFLFFLCSTALQVFATDHVVSSIDEANKILNTAKPNDKIILKAGVYKDAVIKFNNNEIAFVAEHGGKVFFEGNSTLSFSGKKIIIDGFVWQKGGKGLQTQSVIEFRYNKQEALYSILKNCVIDEYNTADYNEDNKWISVYGTYNTVTNCAVKNKYNRGATLVVWLDGTTEAHHTISYNYFFNRQNGPNVDNGLESLRIGTSQTSFTPAHCVVVFNVFEDCDGEIEIISNKSCFNSYIHNTFLNSSGGLTLRHGNNCLVDGNFFDGSKKPEAYGVRFIGEGHIAINNYFYALNGAQKNAFRAPVTLVNGLVNTPLNGYYQVKRAVVDNNVFVNCETPVIRVGAFSKREGMTLAPDSFVIQNNIIINEIGKGNEVYEEKSTPANATIQNNILLGKFSSKTQKGFQLYETKSFKRNGFESVTDADGKIITSIDLKANLINYINVGANEVHIDLQVEFEKRKYTVLSAKEVGPIWNR